MSDWTQGIRARIELARQRLSTLDLVGARERLTAAQQKAAAAAAQHDGTHHLVLEANGAVKQARQALSQREERAQQLQAELVGLEQQLAIPERLTEAQAAAADAVALVSERAAAVGHAEEIVRRLDEQLGHTRRAMEAARQMAGAAMLAAVKAGTTADPGDMARLIAEADAIELAKVSAQAELAEKVAAREQVARAAQQAVHAVEVIAAEASEVELQKVEADYIESAARHQAATWRAHQHAYYLPGLGEKVTARAQQLLNGTPA